MVAAGTGGDGGAAATVAGRAGTATEEVGKIKDGSEMSATEIRRSPVRNSETIGVGGMKEDDIRPVVDGGVIPANEGGTNSSGGGEAKRVSDEVKMATRAARVILAVRDMLREHGVNDRFAAAVLEGLSGGDI